MSDFDLGDLVDDGAAAKTEETASGKRKMLKGYSGRGIQEQDVTARLRDMDHGSFRSGRPKPIHERSNQQLDAPQQHQQHYAGADEYDYDGTEASGYADGSLGYERPSSDSVAPPAPTINVHDVGNSPLDLLQRPPEARRSVSSDFTSRVSNGVGELGRMFQQTLMRHVSSGEKVDRRSDVNRVAAKPRHWSKEEDEMLRNAVNLHGEKQWKKIAEYVPGRNHTQCLQRWSKVLTPGLKKGMWSEEEDRRLLELAHQQLSECRAKGKTQKVQWGVVKNSIPGRTAKQCRERWVNNLNPEIRRDPWTEEEDTTILRLYDSMPKKWAAISKHLPGRTENAVKIRWKSLSRDGGTLSRSSSSTPRSPMSAPPSPAASQRSVPVPFQQHAMQQQQQQQRLQHQRSTTSEAEYENQHQDLLARMGSLGAISLSDGQTPLPYSAEQSSDSISPLHYDGSAAGRGYPEAMRSNAYFSTAVSSDSMLGHLEAYDELSPIPVTASRMPAARAATSPMAPPMDSHLKRPPSYPQQPPPPQQQQQQPFAYTNSSLGAPPTSSSGSNGASASGTAGAHARTNGQVKLETEPATVQQASKRPSLASAPMGGASSSADGKGSAGSWRNSGNFGNLWNDPIAGEVQELLHDLDTSGRGSSFLDPHGLGLGLFESSGNLDVDASSPDAAEAAKP